MPSPNSAPLLDALREYHLLEPTQLAEAAQLQAQVPEPAAFAIELVRRGWLTFFQADLLVQGFAHRLLLGSYILLDRLAEGGMGTIFKAKHRFMGRVVALKVIRKDRLAHPNAARRFRREVQAAAQLDHPNIVHAYDADEISGSLILVMDAEGV